MCAHTPEMVYTIIESIQEPSITNPTITNHKRWRPYEETQPSIQEWPGKAFWNRWPLTSLYKDRQNCVLEKNDISSIFPIIKRRYCWHTSCGFYLIQSRTLITDPGVATKSSLFLPWSIPGCTAWQRSAGKEGEDLLILSSSFMKRIFSKMQTWFYILRKCTLKTEL